ncbi:ATP-binding protein [Lachnospira sp.]|uniref:ATP-binding protein n=1 Tax=Lachnospira sp. TaxID=2049031 RepID=UPI00257FA9D8|nr:ATP-binding protein [Lachnospira sp.]
MPKVTQDPKNLILYGVPKIGKTSLLSTLEDNLIVDFEDGSDYVEALKVKVNSVKDVNELCKAIKEANFPYKFITIDTITALEEFAKPLALKMLRLSPLGSNFIGDDVLQAPHGAGYGFLREAIQKIIDKLSNCAPNLILVGHVKDKAIISMGESQDTNIKELDLTGKTGRILAAKSDAIGFVYRDKDSNLCINFETNGEATAGARPEHLANKRIVVAERQPDGSFKSCWERIYPSLNKKK